MMGPSHRLLGALAGATVASVAGQEWPMVAMTALIATSTAHGWPSPDMDQTGPWRTVGRFLGPLANHRSGLSHWWGLPVLAWWGVQHLPQEAHWPAYALLAGWVSHLLGDFVFGKLSLFPWGGPKFGVGLKTDGFIEDGSLNIGGRKRTVVPFGPTRVAITVALALVLWHTPGMPVGAPGLPSLPAGLPFASATTLTDGDAPDYRRDAFGPAWADVDGNGCKTRDDVLARDLADETKRDRCVVVTGVLEKDLYTGKRIEFSKAKATAVQIDHIVSLSDAWHSGAHAWTDTQRKQFANDPYNLVAVDGPTNASKGAQGPDTWLPKDKPAACRYTIRYELVKAKWGLTNTPAQAKAIGHTIDACENGETP